VVSFTAGVDLNKKASTASSASVLPVNKGGTGANTFASGQALIGNGAGALTTRGIDASPSPGSNNLITSNALNSVKTTVANGIGRNNIYLANGGSSGTIGDSVFVLGQIPLPGTGSASPYYVNFIGDFLTIKQAGPNSIASSTSAKVHLLAGYNNDWSLANNAKIDITKGAAGSIKLGTFYYEEKLYAGLRLNIGQWISQYLSGWYNGNLPTACSETVTMCVGKVIPIAEIAQFTEFSSTPPQPLPTPTPTIEP
jgi:hypothetical protein